MMNWYKRALVPACLAVFVFAFSLTALWLGDDIIYDYSFKDGTQISSFEQLIPSQIAHYQVQNGRIPAHFLCQLFIPFWGQTSFALCNALIYVLWLWLLARLCKIRMDDWRMTTLLACLLILGLRTKFTPTCQIGFPWMFALVTAFLLVFRRFGDPQKSPWPLWHLLWAVPLSFLAGWSNEALVVGVGAALGLYALFHLKRLRISQWFILVAFALGAALLCLSPVSVGRLEETHASSDLLPPLVFSLAKLGFYLRISYLLLFLVLYLMLVRKVTVRELVRCGHYWWIVWAVMLLFNLLIEVYGNRQLFGMELAAIMIIIRCVRMYLLTEDREQGKAAKLALSALVLWVVGVGIGNARFLIHHRALYRTIETAYKASPDGRVYEDLSAAEVTANDFYPSDVFSYHCLGTMSLAYGNDPVLRVVPTLCRHLDERVPGNGWEQIAPGAMAVVIDRNHPPKEIGIQRSLLGRRLPDARISPASGVVFEDERYAVLVVYEKMPMVKNNDVYFVE